MSIFKSQDIYIKRYLLLLIISTSSLAHAQNNFFSEVGLVKKTRASDIWSSSVSCNYRHIFDPIGWRKISIDASINRKSNNWEVKSGLGSKYKFDKDIVNYVELRPWLGLQLQTNINAKFQLFQLVKTEWRQFLYINNPSEGNNRIRYNLGVTYSVLDGMATSKLWKLKAEFEWYFIKKNNLGERFANSRDFRLKSIFRLRNNHLLTIGYKYERYFKTVNPNSINGNTLMLSYEL